MRIFFLLILFAGSLGSDAQRISFEVTAGAGMAFSHSPSQNFVSGIRHVDSLVGSTYYYKETTVNNTIVYESKTGPVFSLGGKANYRITHSVGISAGAGIQVFTLSRTHRRSYTALHTESKVYTTPPNQIGILIEDFPVMLLQSIGKEEYKFFTVQFPVSFFVERSKWRFEAGITPALLLSSERGLEKSYDPELIVVNNFENKEFASFSLSVSPSYRITEKLRVGLCYEHGLNNLVTNSMQEPYKLPGIYSRNLQIKLLVGLKKENKPATSSE